MFNMNVMGIWQIAACAKTSKFHLYLQSQFNAMDACARLTCEIGSLGYIVTKSESDYHPLSLLFGLPKRPLPQV